MDLTYIGVVVDLASAVSEREAYEEESHSYAIASVGHV